MLPKLNFRLFLPLLLLLICACSGTSTEFQKDADIIRLKHLKYYSDLLTEYHEKTGSYPFIGKVEVPLYVYIANEKQVKYTEEGPAYEHKVASFSEFVSELEDKLGRGVAEYYDPQYRPVNKPNYYVYMASGNSYFLAIHVHQPFSFARKVADDYYKVEISNNPSPKNKAHDPKLLFELPNFKIEASKSISKPDFFAEREIKYIRHTKDSS